MNRIKSLAVALAVAGIAAGVGAKKLQLRRLSAAQRRPAEGEPPLSHDPHGTVDAAETGEWFESSSQEGAEPAGTGLGDFTRGA